ncbi:MULTISPECIES: pyrroline-5-carboxylate reductase [Subtercola]|uniref:Pyrroline-5-carboxylate reductase n=1 Tax=Subtercola vilae TaxID=2056433 RepID=A0A4T2C6T9_9MICO|nr:MULTISPECIES: pyrroline-5-carboxylate reductase [Subtercola]MEA9984738.1 pyrroline-5-carboxylate reductase [Subtercola sp. RTI3]TIH39021.1 pyrroline-5-carboxylate reductase [Subtercola vilae]
MTDQRTVRLPSISILGTGSMGRAILSGLLAPSVEVDGGIRVTNRTATSAALLPVSPALVSFVTTDTADANVLAVRGAAIVLVAVKPHMVPDLLDEIAPVLEPGTIVVSVAAGVTIATFEAHLPPSVAVIRSMPNTPAAVGRGVTGVSAGTRSTPAQLETVSRLFSTVGEVVEVAESQIDALSTISGSGPAYVYLLIEKLTAAAVEKGFTPAQAAQLVNGTFAGATELLRQSGASAEQLRVQVTSPKGTTERALAVLQDARLDDLFIEATSAALARARELAAG